jgi:hypothetical protein
VVVNKDDTLADRYEEIRRNFFDRRQGVPMWGYVVLKTKGMVAWAKSWREHGESGEKYVPNVPSVSSASHLPPGSDEVVRVLAGMVLAVQKEAMP